MKQWLVVALLGLCPVVSIAADTASSYPERPVQLIVPFPAGGGVDMVARLLGSELAKSWGKPVVVENRAGAGGNIGAAAVANAKPDGHSLLLVPTGVIILAPLMFDDVGYKPESLTSVSIVVGLPQILMVPANSRFNSLKELLAYAKAHPGELNVGSSGKGTGQHMAIELLMNKGNIRMTHIPYRGSATAMTAVVGGEIDLLFVDPAALSFVKSGRLKALAVTTKERTSSLPDVPAISEEVPGYEAASYYALMAPAATPSAILNKINSSVTTALSIPDLRNRLMGDGMVPVEGSSEFATDFTKNEFRKWTGLIKAAGISLK